MSIDATRSTWLLTKKEVTPTQKLILLSYADRAGEGAECWPSNARLEKDTGLDRHTICSNKQDMISKGLLSYTGEKKGRTKSIDVVRLNYVLHRESSGEMRTAQNVSSGEMPIPSSGEMPIAKQWGNAHTESISSFNLSEEPKAIVDSTNTTLIKKLSSYKKDERFMRFYSHYPKKEKPGDAWKAFKSLKPDDELLEIIIEDVKNRALKHTQWSDKQFVPLPATYLRAASYEGEIYNGEEARKENKSQKAKESEERLKAQEDAYLKRADKERVDQNLKYSDGISYRKLEGNIESRVAPDAWNELKKKLNVRTK